MYPLIKKDILIQKKVVTLAIFMMLFFAVTLSPMGPGATIVGILTVTYMFVLGASATEDKNKSDIILVSLPIKKQTIVLAKYLSVYVFATYAILLYAIIYFGVQLLHIPFDMSFTQSGIISTLFIITVFFAISFPMIFKYGYLKAKTPNLILFFILVFGGTALVNNLDQLSNWTFIQNTVTFLSERTETQLLLLLLPIAFVILVISYFISLRFYQEREF
ncbi:ABC-2 transporter permease [Massilibacterium senegalense]|uniref:ABC-2 transporter permease n=1 Tax=Massilibacterium senegalense TaxID=1632858 RepID=UPI000785BCCB|nr:ABC-2 transporter permease [Massilibacterium senegalense]